ncbi:MAG: hypothetical protein ACKKMP_02275 [Candidatus Nealsonbacteria bacterium]
MRGFRPKIIILVVYKAKDGNWRGFCSPYDITCEAETRLETMKRIKKSFKLYEEGLEKYGYPKHLSLRKLSDAQDRRVFEIVKKKIFSDIQKNLLKFQAKEKGEFRIREPMSLSGYYLCPV